MNKFGNWALVLAALYILHGTNSSDAVNEEFFEIDVTKIRNEYPVRFGSEVIDRGEETTGYLMKKMGEVSNIVRWNTMWSVTQFGAAPWNCSRELMDFWIDKVYKNLHQKMEYMHNTSKIIHDHNNSYIMMGASLPMTYIQTDSNKRYQKYVDTAEAEGREHSAEEFSRLEKENKLEKGQYSSIIIDGLDDISKFWASTLQYFKNDSIQLDYFTVIERPDEKSSKGSYLSPDDLVTLILKLKGEMEYYKVTEAKMVVPSVSTPAAFRSYLEAIVKNKEAYDAISAWSAQIVDNSYLLSDIEVALDDMHKAIEELTPEGWERKPVFISRYEFSDNNPATNTSDLPSGRLDKCYRDFHNRPTVYEVLNETISQQPWLATRLFAGANIVMQTGASFMYRECCDMRWLSSCHGFTDRLLRPKQLLTPFKLLMPYMDTETYPLEKQWENKNECFISAYRRENTKPRVLLTVTNNGNQPCYRSFSLQGLNLKRLGKVIVRSYNNGSVDIEATSPSMALSIKKDLNYDVYEEDIEEELPASIEFDINLGPHALATVVVNALLEDKIEKVDNEEGASVETNENPGEEVALDSTQETEQIREIPDSASEDTNEANKDKKKQTDPKEEL